MSDNAQVESGPIQELEVLVGHLADELASFRRRAQSAESRLRELEAHAGGVASLELARRVAELEQENERLSTKLGQARERARQMLDRVKFLRQQAAQGGNAGSASTTGSDR